jgi:hypothetical protein
MRWHEGLTLFVEFVRAIAWPLAILIIVWRIRPALMTVLQGRHVELQGFGIRAIVRALEQQQNTPAVESPVTKPPVAAQIAPLPDRPALQSLQQTIKGLVAQIPQQDREAALLRGLSIARRVSKHEFVYNRIFGSQIVGLKRLDEVGSVTTTQAREFFETHAKQFPTLEKYGFDNWLGFMVNNELVAREGDNFKITVYGHDFLVYLVEARLVESRPL